MVTAENGRDAIECLQRVPHPCLVLLDLMMPVMDGSQFLGALRADDRLAPLPVVVVTAWHEDVVEGENVQGVIKKPIDIDLLLRFVERYCGMPLKPPRHQAEMGDQGFEPI